MTERFESYRKKLADSPLFSVAASSLYISERHGAYSPQLRYPLERIYDIPGLTEQGSDADAPLFEASGRRSLTCVAAKAGSGKTMLACMLSKALTVDDPSPELCEFIARTGLRAAMDAGLRYPALLLLRHLTAEDIESHLVQHFGLTSAADLWRNRSRILLILDGLEETNRKLRDNVFEFLRRWLPGDEAAHVIILMRPDEARLPDWLSNGEVCGVRWLKIRPMDESHIFGDGREGLVYRVLRCVRGEAVANAQGDFLRQFYRGYDYIRNLCQTPLNVLMVTNMLLSRQALPDKYNLEQYVLIHTIENLLRWKQTKKSRIDANTRMRVLSYCALMMESEATYTVPVQQFIEWFEAGIAKLDYWVTADRALIGSEVQTYISSLGLLRDRHDPERDCDMLEFAHREFQSVLAANAVLVVYNRRIDLGRYASLLDIINEFLSYDASNAAMLRYLFQSVYELEDSNCHDFRLELFGHLCRIWSDDAMQQFVGWLEMTEDEKYHLLRQLSPLTPSWCSYLKKEKSFLQGREGWIARLLEDKNDPQSLDVAGVLYGMDFESRDAIRDEILKAAPGDERIPLLAAAFAYHFDLHPSHYYASRFEGVNHSSEVKCHAMFERLAADQRIDLLIRMHLYAATKAPGSWLPNETHYEWFTPELVHRAIDRIVGADSETDLYIAVSRLVFPPVPELLKDAAAYAAAHCEAVKDRIARLEDDFHGRNVGLLFARHLTGGEEYAVMAEKLRNDLIHLAGASPRLIMMSWPYQYYLRKSAAKMLPLPRQIDLPKRLSRGALFDDQLSQFLLSFDEAALRKYPVACSLLLTKLNCAQGVMTAQHLSTFSACPEGEGIRNFLCRILNEAQPGPIATMHRLLMQCFYHRFAGDRTLLQSEMVSWPRLDCYKLVPMVEKRVTGQEKQALTFLQNETVSFTAEDWRLVLEHWARVFHVETCDAVWVYLTALTCAAGRSCFEQLDGGWVCFRNNDDTLLKFDLISLWHRTGGCCLPMELGVYTKMSVDILLKAVSAESVLEMWVGHSLQPEEIAFLNYVNGQFDDGENITSEDYHMLMSCFVAEARRGNIGGYMAMTGSLLYSNARTLLTTEDRVTWTFRINNNDAFCFRPADWFETIARWTAVKREGPPRKRELFMYLQKSSETSLEFGSHSVRSRDWFAYLRNSNETWLRYEAHCLAPEPVRRFVDVLRSSDDASGELGCFSAEDWLEILYHYTHTEKMMDVRDTFFSPAILALRYEAGRMCLESGGDDSYAFRLRDRTWRLYPEGIPISDLQPEERYTYLAGNLYWDNAGDRLVVPYAQ